MTTASLPSSSCLQFSKNKKLTRQFPPLSSSAVIRILLQQSIQHPHFYACKRTLSYLVVAVHSSSNLAAALRSCCCGDAVAKGEGLVAMVAGRVLKWSLWGGVELQGTLGKKSRSYWRRQEQCRVERDVEAELSFCLWVCTNGGWVKREGRREISNERGKQEDWEARNEIQNRERSNLEQIVQQCTTPWVGDGMHNLLAEGKRNRGAARQGEGGGAGKCKRWEEGSKKLW